MQRSWIEDRVEDYRVDDGDYTGRPSLVWVVMAAADGNYVASATTLYM